MDKIKIATLDNIDDLVIFHKNNFESYYLTNLGNEMLKKYYTFFIKNKKNKCYLYEEDNVIRGIALFVDDFDKQIGEFYKANIFDLGKSIAKKIFLLNLVVIKGTISRVRNTIVKKRRVELLPTVTLLSLATSSNCRGKGIASKLLHNAESDLLQQGVNEYYLSVLKNNPEAIKFYKNFNFSQISSDNELIYLLRKIIRR